ncbi:MAG: hypothetical protein Q9201_007501, partial [Fulgogasparrea decipioides]
MPDIDPAALSRSDSTATFNPSTLNPIKSNGVSAPSSAKAQKTTNAAQRIDLEPLYASLKGAIGDNWGRYKDAISLFILGHLNENELSLQINHCVCAETNTEHLHNQLVAAIYGNVLRDVPDQGVAPWISANDKPTLLSKPLAGDEAEQRLKREVMQLPARDRRRIKEVADVSYLAGQPCTCPQMQVQGAWMSSFVRWMSVLTFLPSTLQGQITDPLEISIARSAHEYHQARQIKLPDAVPASAGGQVKT